jgi:GntR family transcriptional regulator/MocR family aminotransferase
MPKLLQLELDRRAKTPLAEQIRNGIRNAIETGILASGARLPSWQDLAAQLGVARGTVRSAYEKLSAAQLIARSNLAQAAFQRRLRCHHRVHNSGSRIRSSRRV